MPPFESSTFFCPSTEDYPRAKQAIEFIYRRTKIPEAFVGKGGAATVWNLAGRMCAKVMEPRHNSPHRAMMNLGNTVAREFEIQYLLRDLVVEGVRVPYPIAYLESTESDGLNAILMEEMDAVDLQHILRKEAKLPGSFDRTSFLDALEQFIHTMHNEKRIAHGDLAPRNIMIDRKTGRPIVIDFGRAKHITNIHAQPIKSAIISDNKWVDRIGVLLEKFEAGALTEDDLHSIEM